MRLIIYSTSAPEFKRQADETYRVWKGQGFDVWKIAVETKGASPKRKRDMLAYSLAQISNFKAGPSPYIDVAAIYCHGRKNSIEIGYRSADADKLADLIAPIRCIHTLIALWCCNTGKAFGFGQKLSAAAGQAVIAHTNAGHTTGNPNKVLFTAGVPRGRLNDLLGIPWGEWKTYSRRGRVDETELTIIDETRKWLDSRKADQLNK